ncbi:tetratricopeptide repeat protein [Taibaiella soli]|uniref:Pilus assembly protein TadD n=1 Tax=Taibaiella soli TaxID=1649169 RepID=A0A2W2BFV7_9BACT|nr:tetratricopeptide repeat protein [Taibaiella soli]PZF72346.1 pilus assembly protein TadD [Taibaiella soli]
MSRFYRTILITLALVGATLPTFFCNSPKNDKSGGEAEGSPWRNVYDTTVHYVGMQTCRTCHEDVYRTFSQTGMGQSFDYATRQKSAADFSPAHALVYDKDLDFYYKPYWNNDSLYIMEFRLAGKDTVHKRIQKIDYIVGSGQHTNSHIFNVNGYLYQAPITFYTQKKKWDLAPGFENGASSRFGRMIEIECMSCHNGYPQFEANSQNKFVSLKTGIDCERCHGPGSLHVQEKQAGNIVDTSKGPDYTIVNPRRLPTDLQNNVCQRCHLQGISVLNDGKSFFDFHPGMKLSEVMNVFMPEYEGARDKMIMASHVERMKKSQCYVVSGKMSCITCHNPHVSVKFTPRSQYLNACQSCHGAVAKQVQCSEKPEIRATKNNDCVTCHMPHNSSIDIPHVAVTDHYIRKRPQNDTLEPKITAFLGLKCFNNDNVDAITIARAYMEFYERYNQNKGLLDSAIFYLNKQADVEANQKQNRDFIRAYFLLNDYNKVAGYAAAIQPADMKDAWTAYRIGESYMQLQQAPQALPWYKQATTIWPYSLDFQSKYGIALLSMNRYEEAQKVYSFIISENPNYAVANTNLGFLYMQEGNNTMAYEFLSRSQMLDPDNEQMLINLAVYYHSQMQNNKAQKCLEHLLQKHPQNERAKAMLADLAR